ncbi:MAG: hypothetical protein SF123_07600 [Chloroflexota bacterium]|nr:hypothetical protein [Chloroflexota bacterium]
MKRYFARRNETPGLEAACQWFTAKGWMTVDDNGYQFTRRGWLLFWWGRLHLRLRHGWKGTP